ncbi:filamentous hemagglutinin, partial [Leptospira sp. SA-E8]
NAQKVFVGSGVRLKADATGQGNGGKIIVWADDWTRFYGGLSARGAGLGGNGGFAEVSGKQNLTFAGTADLGSTWSSRGTLLLDPNDLYVGVDPANGAT